MIRNIDLLMEMQKSIHKLYFLTDDIFEKCESEKTSISMLIDMKCKKIQAVLTIIDDIDRILDSLTEDIKSSLLNEGFDSDDYKVRNVGLRLEPCRLGETLDSVIEQLRILELYILESIRGYKILTQLAYDMNPRLPGLKQQAEKN